MNKAFATCIFILSLTLAIFPARAQSDRLTVVASVFPLYEFARVVAGSSADVRILLPAGVEPHSWEPKPSDIVFLSRADIFLYVGQSMEPWAHDLASAVKEKKLLTVDIMDRLGLSGGDGRGKDPHFWLNLSLSARTVEMMGKLLADGDPANRERYLTRAREYALALEQLDERFRAGLAKCGSRRIVTGGHAAFGYLAQRYGLEQVSVYGLSPDSEPTPRQLAGIVNIVKGEGVDTIFSEEMMNPRMAQVLSRETGTRIMSLNSGVNLTAAQWQTGMTFMDIMKQNLENLREGLSCE